MIRHAPLLAATFIVAGLASSMEATFAQGMISRGRITERKLEILRPQERGYGPERRKAIEELQRRFGLEPDVLQLHRQGSGEEFGPRLAPLSPPLITVQPRSLSKPLITNDNNLQSGASSLRRGSDAVGDAVSPQ